MAHNIEKRLSALEGARGQSEPPNEAEEELMRILLEDYYSGEESKLVLTPAQTKMMEESKKWFVDNGLWEYYFRSDK
jgi:hypothetical protein